MQHFVDIPACNGILESTPCGEIFKPNPRLRAESRGEGISSCERSIRISSLV